ncbi:MAG: response regulator [Nitrosospira sp.]|nr:response regulator [Nitrosospira sp.]
MEASKTLILNVDDNEGARYAKTRVLRKAGFQVAEAANGTDTIAFVEQNKPDLVLLDVKLPDINGIEVCRHIKGKPSSASVLVLQTSAALTDREDRIKGLDGGADNYLVAPIEADELVANVRALLRLRSTQADLRDSEERFRELAENIEDVFWVVSNLSQVLYISPSYEKMWQRSIQHLTGSPDDWLNGVHVEDQHGIREKFHGALMGDEYDEEYRIVQPAGADKWVRDRAYPVKNPQGEIYRVVRITNDISVRKNAEQLLREADNNKNVFLATLAHELRNPLAPIRNAVALMQRADESSVEVQKKARDVIIRQVDHLAHLVDDLLDVARISEDKIVLRKTRAELHTIVQVAVEAVAPLLSAREQAFELYMPSETIWLEVDPVRLSQCIGNLLHNAAKFTPQAGRIALRIIVSDDIAKIVVEDNGIGISADKMEQVFGLFQQGEISTDQVQDGLGIGLSLTKRLIELHGGYLNGQSGGTGLGSRFTIELPAAVVSTSEPVEDAVRATPPPRNRENLNILIVDDNKDSREIMALLLSTMGHRVLQAPDALSAIDTAKRHPLDAVISDIGLPGLDGYYIARTLRSDPDFAELPLIALTGYGRPEDRRKTEEAGFDHHFVKPLDVSELISFLNNF